MASLINSPLLLGLPDDGLGVSARSARDIAWPEPLSLLRLILCGRFAEAETVAAGLDEAGWRSFGDLAIERHRVAPALAEALDKSNLNMPAPVSRTIRDHARSSGMAALAQRAESIRLAEIFAAHGIFPVWLKGWPLAQELYGAAGLRHANDIDLLVTPDERLRAAECLADEGYVPFPEVRQRATLLASPGVAAECKDVAYHLPETGLAIDLHWRTNHFRGWPDLGGFGEDYRDLPGIAEPVRIRVPGPVGQLIYLASHGQQHLFSRLKWLLDIARLAERRGAERLNADLARAEAAGAGRQVRLALHLAWRVFGVSVPQRVVKLFGHEEAWCAQILASIADDGSAHGRLRTRLDFYRWHWRMAENRTQRVAVLSNMVWRPLWLRLAGLRRLAG